MKFDLERAKKEGFLYKNRGELVRSAFLEVVNQGDIHETLIFKFLLGATWYCGAIKTSMMDDFFRNMARKLCVVILDGDKVVFTQGFRNSHESIAEYVNTNNLKNVLTIKCIYREGEE